MNSFDRPPGIQWTRDVLAGCPGAVRACGYSSSPSSTGTRSSRRPAARGAAWWPGPGDRSSGEASQDFENGIRRRSSLTSTACPSWSSSPMPRSPASIPRRAHRVEPAAPRGIRRQRRDADLGRRSPAVRFVRVRRRQPGAEAARHRGQPCRLREVWANQRVRIHFGNAVRIGPRSSRPTATLAPRPSRRSTSGPARWCGGIAVSRGRRSSGLAISWCCSTRMGTWRWRRPATTASTLHGKSPAPRGPRLDGADAERDHALRARPARNRGARPPLGRHVPC